ncbi:MAG: hypothetical protein GX876_06340 [Bacteroidales bacterium]|nr:hypothetical protein [Bacteroidales bacterium]
MKAGKKTLIFAMTVMVIAFVTSCRQKQTPVVYSENVKYYRSLLFSETPFDYERGSRELTESQARDINHYRFIYDNSGRLISVEYGRGDALLGYSGMGGAAKITYEYRGNKQIKRFFNERNESVESGGVFTAEYELNSGGTRTGLRFFDRNGKAVENNNKIHFYTWAVLNDGMVQEKRYNLAGEETIMNQFCPFYELRFTYNDKGYLVRMANYMNDMLYNCTAENCGDIGVSFFTFKPNEYGEVEDFSVFNVTGQMSNLYWGWSKRVSKYDENGYLLETAVFDQDNEYLGGKNIPLMQNKYDVHGALIETRNLDSNRNIVNHPVTGVAITEYKYDDRGNRLETLRFSRDGKPVSI